jgi:malonate decarboxylase gamma subunit
VFAPGAINYVRMGAIDALWDGNLAERLLDALGRANVSDRRSAVGHERGGRALAHLVARRVADA